MSFFKTRIQKALGKTTRTRTFAEGRGGVTFEVIEPNDQLINEEAADFKRVLKRVAEGPAAGCTGNRYEYLVRTIHGKQYFLEHRGGGDFRPIDIRISIPSLDYSKTRCVQTWRAQTWRVVLINGDECMFETLPTPVEPGVTVRDLCDRMETEERMKNPPTKRRDSEDRSETKSEGLDVQEGKRPCKVLDEPLKPALPKGENAPGSLLSEGVPQLEYNPNGQDQSCRPSFETLPAYRELDGQ
ncbi:hypothetical protein TWF281_010452 [Arthrobotrys megalospora]